MSDTSHLADSVKALGQGSTQYAYSAPDAKLLEAFPNPAADPKLNPAQAGMRLEISCPEFTSLCPKTGQPDFATISINYVPDKLCVESKSLKLYLGSFRNHGEFHEACVNRIANDLVALLQPHQLQIQGQFTPRGGIPFWPTVTYMRPLAMEFAMAEREAHGKANN
jgi:7-cyano-7-deazaguanine reductase